MPLTTFYLYFRYLEAQSFLLIAYMEDIGNLVYILAAIAYLIYNGYKSTRGKANKQQTRRQRQQRVPQQQRVPEFEQPTPQTITLEDLLRGKTQESPREPVAQPIFREEEFKTTRTRPEVTPITMTKKKRTVRRRRIPALDEPFNLKKAVIYDVIMKRPRQF